ncbi:hypothetical protein B0T26DRAFT_274404 [Lasiosphaeria miniovina]|uniref:RING-type domain-containing protein n=1 Tax=Lasiosphaeria miniovina TaxID=1954250 RepID=A0AA40AJQ7_9PEZI|nr:uncharacterized protein B0T26DRAFT_274404 [Lasiosphaeria miniovina]KAK0717015.1 hypothetical protein B0T26DRAFT_274404 [Lasiosphaeria miniovina]
MDEMDYVMHNPDSSASQAQNQHVQQPQGCPYFRADHHPASLPNPHPHPHPHPRMHPHPHQYPHPAHPHPPHPHSAHQAPGLMSANRGPSHTHYDPVHAVSDPWISTPYGAFQWTRGEALPPHSQLLHSRPSASEFYLAGGGQGQSSSFGSGSGSNSSSSSSSSSSSGPAGQAGQGAGTGASPGTGTQAGPGPVQPILAQSQHPLAHHDSFTPFTFAFRQPSIRFPPIPMPSQQSSHPNHSNQANHLNHQSRPAHHAQQQLMQQQQPPQQQQPQQPPPSQMSQLPQLMQQSQQQQQHHHQQLMVQQILRHQQQQMPVPPQTAPHGGINLPVLPSSSAPTQPSNMPSSGDSSPTAPAGRQSTHSEDSPRGTSRGNGNSSSPRTTASISQPARPILFGGLEPARAEAGPSVAVSSDSDTPPPPRLTPPIQPNTERRRNFIPRPRFRRNTALNSDYDSEEDPDQIEDDEQALRFIEQFSVGPYHRDFDETRVRAHQLLRGQMSNKRVASKKALAQLQSVDLDSLEESERTCVICYNVFSVETPEGVKEAPLRLPKCKHIFGDHCIKKWFEESDSCPYCRDKVHSEPAYQSSANAIREFLRASYGNGTRFHPHMPPGETRPPPSGEFIRLAAQRDDSRPDNSPPRTWQTGERRSPPSEPSSRRTRARHGSFRGSPSTSTTATASANASSNNNGSTRQNPPAGTNPAGPQQQSPARERFASGGHRPYQYPGNMSRPPNMPLLTPVDLSQQNLPPQLIADFTPIMRPRDFLSYPLSPMNGGPGHLAGETEQLPGPTHMATFPQQLPPVRFVDGSRFSGASNAANGPPSAGEGWLQ